MLSYFSKPKKTTLLWSALIALALAILAWVAFQNRFILNPDGVAYISIAEHYATGRWSAAINAYWSPLLSWLMAPFLWLGLNGQEAFAVLNFFTGSTILLFGNWLCWRITHSWKVATLYTLCITPFLVHLMTAQITPDGLVIVWVLVAIAVVSVILNRLKANPSNTRILQLAALLAFLGFMGYVTKLYLQPVFLGVLILIVALYSWHCWQGRQPQKRVALFAATTIGLYTLISLAWITPLSMKYGEFTVGSSYSFNTGAQGLPQTRLLLAPPHDAALTAWEDPTLLVQYQQPSSDSSVAENPIVGHAKKVYHDFPFFIEKINGLWILLFAPILLAALYLLSRRELKAPDISIMSALLLFITYFGGYAARGGIGNHRYQWPLLVISILLAALLSAYLWQYIAKQRLQVSASIATGLVLLILPFTLFLQYIAYPHHHLRPNEKPELQIIAEDIKAKNIIPRHTAIAASDFGTATHLSYYLDTPTFGTFDPSYSLKNKEARAALAQHNVLYFIDIASPAAENDYEKYGRLLYSYELNSYCEGACQLNVVMIDD